MNVGRHGAAPVTHQSGKSRGVACRWPCNKRLRLAITTIADNSRAASAWAAEIYQRARQHGADHPHATRILARAWARVLWRAWANCTSHGPPHVEMVILFEGRGVHREALAAALLFQRAAQQESLSRGLLRDLASRLERACIETKATRKPRRRQPKLRTE